MFDTSKHSPSLNLPLHPRLLLRRHDLAAWGVVSGHEDEPGQRTRGHGRGHKKPDGAGEGEGREEALGVITDLRPVICL